MKIGSNNEREQEYPIFRRMVDILAEKNVLSLTIDNKNATLVAINSEWKINEITTQIVNSVIFISLWKEIVFLILI